MLSSKNFVTVVMRTPPVGKVGCGWSPRPDAPGTADRSRRTGFSPVKGCHSSMHRRAKGFSAFKRAPVALRGQLLEKLHHRFFGWIGKAPAGDALGSFKQFFGFGHESLALCE